MSASSDLLPIGSRAPEFEAKDGSGARLSLKELTAKSNVVLIFYPGDNTPVCTAQLCSFRDSYSQLQSRNSVVLGVNPAAEAKHAGFSQKHSFPFPLIVDAGATIAAAYHCKMLFGIIKRTVYVIGTDGTILYASRGNPAVSEILAALESPR